MTHKDIYTKYMIEYDKANITSSYPALTEYEVAIMLDKAYLALISQKVTGNNIRKTTLENDLKSISDLQPLITTKRILFGTIDVTNTPETAYTVSEALALMADNRTMNSMMYIHGEVTLVENVDLDYGDAVYEITDNENTLKIFRGRYLGNNAFDNVDLIQDGDYVVVYGKLEFGISTSEIRVALGNYIYSINNDMAATNNVEYLVQFPETNLFYESTTTEQRFRKESNMLTPIKQKYISTSAESIPDNVRELVIPSDMLFYISGSIPVDIRLFSGWMNDTDYTEMQGSADTKDNAASVRLYKNQLIPLDNSLVDYSKEGVSKTKHYRMLPIKLVSHEVAEKFFATAHNIPWVKTPVAYLENNMLFVVVDPIAGVAKLPYSNTGVKPDGAAVEDGDCSEWMNLTYIKQPAKFSGDVRDFVGLSKDTTVFELNDVVAEELISLAISYALEHVESPRLNTHIGMRGLEA